MDQFDMCMKEAQSLIWNSFRPELDNLESQTVESVVVKVQIELDLLEENQDHFDDESEFDKETWKSQAKSFLKKWSESSST